jgi:hypothetical protein
MHSIFIASTILLRVMQNPLFLSRYSNKLNAKHYVINDIISNEVNFDVLYTIYSYLIGAVYTFL